MSFWVLLQVLINLVLLAAVGVLWIRLNRPAKDDPRLSKGLQLLQSKIAVLEDLSDRTEIQVSQLTALLETKCREIQEKIVAADRQISLIDSSAQKSLEVAKIFQDRIPHSEILERQNTIKYVKAARMAHAGASVDEISQQVEMSRAEIEFIAKVNREQLQFSEADLPDWAREERTSPAISSAANPPAENSVSFSLPRQNFDAAFQNVKPSEGQSFMEIDLAPAPAPYVPPAVTPVAAAAPKVAEKTTETAKTTSGKTVEIRPVNFRKVQSNNL